MHLTADSRMPIINGLQVILWYALTTRKILMSSYLYLYNQTVFMILAKLTLWVKVHMSFAHLPSNFLFSFSFDLKHFLAWNYEFSSCCLLLFFLSTVQVSFCSRVQETVCKQNDSAHLICSLLKSHTYCCSFLWAE